jgi:hypothetical protein
MMKDDNDKEQESGCLILMGLLLLGFTTGVIIVYLLLK